MIRTKTIPDENYINIGAQTGGNSKSTGGDGLTYRGGGDDNSGWDDGTRDLPKTVRGLTSEEFDTIKNHTLIGAKILGGSASEILQTAAEIAMTHHEKWNGKGYPEGLSGTEIPLAGRIVAIADVFDALTSKRPYKVPLPVEAACNIIEKERGEHFDPKLTDLFFSSMDEVLKIKAENTPEDER